MAWARVWVVAWALQPRGGCYRSSHRPTRSRRNPHPMPAVMPPVALLDGAPQHSSGSPQWSADPPSVGPRACCRPSAPGYRPPPSWSLHLPPELLRLLQPVEWLVACRRWTPEFVSRAILPTANAPSALVPPGQHRRDGSALSWCWPRVRDSHLGSHRDPHCADDPLR